MGLLHLRQPSRLLSLQDNVKADVCLTIDKVKQALDQMRGAVMIVYPMGLPPHDPVRMELEDQEDLSGTQVYCSKYTVSHCIRHKLQAKVPAFIAVLSCCLSLLVATTFFEIGAF